MELEHISAEVNRIPLVDAHAHNLVDVESCFPFVPFVLTEAQWPAYLDVTHSLSFKRGLRDIADLYNVDDSLETITTFRQKTGLEALTAKCFEAANISSVLLDDGLDLIKKKGLEWHKKVARNVYRILRIESVAESILRQEIAEEGKIWTLDRFKDLFVEALKSQVTASNDSTKVVGFKSIAAFRSGLKINPTVPDLAAEKGLLQTIGSGPSVRLTNKDIIDWIFVKSLEVATALDLPLQIPTGFGDKDLDLQANPIHLRAVLEDSRFQRSKIVLLHASYPYMREAAYLSSVYSQVHLDIGLTIPKPSVNGMKAAFAELLELAPLNKLMFSTGGYAFPETFYLGAKWARKVIADVLASSVLSGDLSVGEAVDAAKGILRLNSLVIYKIEESQPFETSMGIVTDRETGPTKSLESSSSLILEDAKFVRILWCDTSGQRRCRVVPIERYKKVVATKGVTIPEAIMAFQAHFDVPAPDSGLGCTGEVRFVPDVSTLVEVPHRDYAWVLGNMYAQPGRPWALCPRDTLRRLTKLLESEFSLTLRAGFEMEFYILKRSQESQNWEGVDSTPYCSSSGLTQSLQTLNCITNWLETMKINYDQFHSEIGGGQFEISLAHEPGIKAGDNLLYAREGIVAAASSQNVHATFLPKLELKNATIGSGSHVHISLWKDGNNVFSGTDSLYGLSKIGSSFLSGVLSHLPAILAIVAPHPNSHKRIQPRMCSGAFLCWGRSNREAPLRLAGQTDVNHEVTNFEFKSFDGCANPHLGLAAITAAGLDGLRKGLELPAPVDEDPNTLKEGSLVRLPASSAEAALRLQEDEVLRNLLGEELVKVIAAVRRGDEEYYLHNSGDNLPMQY